MTQNTLKIASKTTREYLQNKDKTFKSWNRPWHHETKMELRLSVSKNSFWSEIIRSCVKLLAAKQKNFLTFRILLLLLYTNNDAGNSSLFLHICNKRWLTGFGYVPYIFLLFWASNTHKNLHVLPKMYSKKTLSYI